MWLNYLLGRIQPYTGEIYKKPKSPSPRPLFFPVRLHPSNIVIMQFPTILLALATAANAHYVFPSLVTVYKPFW